MDTTGAASSGHRGPGAMAAAAAAPPLHAPAAPAAGQPLDHWLVQPDEQEGPPTQPPVAAGPPGIGPMQMPPEDGGGRDNGGGQRPARRPVGPPLPRTASAFDIATPQRDGGGGGGDDGGDDDDEDNSDGSQLDNGSRDSQLNEEIVDIDPLPNDPLMKIAEAMDGINKTIELLTRRMNQLDDRRIEGKGDGKGKGDSEGLQAINHKDVDKPTRYNGTQWLAWSADFAAFLDRRDRRWSKLLAAIEENSIDPLTSRTKELIAKKADINKGTLVEDFTGQLYEYLKSYTSGEALSRLVSGGKANSWEAWRIMSDQGKSRRKLENHEEYKRLMSPGQSTTESILRNIAQWERDLAIYTAANSDITITEELKKLILENMCPEALQEHLTDKLEQGLIDNYDQYKQAISTYVYRKTRKGKATGKK